MTYKSILIIMGAAIAQILAVILLASIVQPRTVAPSGLSQVQPMQRLKPSSAQPAPAPVQAPVTSNTTAPPPPVSSPSTPAPITSRPAGWLLAVTEPWPPYMGPELDSQGFLPELLKEALARSGKNVESTFIPWARAVKDVQEGNADVLLGAYYTTEREAFLAFSTPIAEVQDVLLSMKGRNITYQTLADLKPYSIGVVRGAAHGDVFDAADFLRKEEVTHREQNIDKLINGRVDLIAGPKDVMLYLIKKDYPLHADQIEVIYPPLNDNKLYLGFSKLAPQQQDSLSAFEHGLSLLKQDGTFQQLADKHGVTVITDAASATPPTPRPAPTAQVRAVTEPWPPYMGPELDNQGFLPEVLKEALSRVGYDVNVQFEPWARAVSDVRTGDADVLLGAYFTEEREAFLSFSPPIAEVQDVLFSMTGRNVTYRDLSDLKPFTIGVVRGAAHGQAFDSATFLKKEEVTRREQNIEKLITGRIDLMAGPKDVIQYLLRRDYPPHVNGNIEVILPPLDNNKLFLGFSRQSPHHDALSGAFERGLSIVKQDGTFSRIAEKHGITAIH